MPGWADPTNPTAPQILAGKQRVRGFEANALGHLTDEWEITAGYTYLRSETVSSTDLASVGAPLLNTAPNQGNLWLVYEFRSPWKAGAGFNFLDRRAADVDNTAHVPSYVTFDAMAALSGNAGHLHPIERLQPGQQVLLHQFLFQLAGGKPRGAGVRDARDC